MTSDLATLDATAQAELVRSRGAKPLDLVDAAIARIEKVNPQLNAVITPLFEKARAQATAPDLPAGPFRGVPFLLKDLDAHSAGDPFHCGMRALKSAGFVAPYDTYMVAKYRAAGLIFLGKTNTPELGLNVTTEPESYGPCRNPWNTDHSTGGSSGGSAAAVASGMVPAAHASDGGGSIRIPASECGLVGLKPSRGRISMGPEFGEYWHGLVTSHVVTRSVRDCASMLDVVSGAMPGDPYAAPPQTRPFANEAGAPTGRLKIGIMRRLPGNTGPLHPDCVAAVDGAAGLLQSLGHIVEESHPAAMDDPELSPHFTTMVTAWTAASLEYWSARIGRPIGAGDVEPATWTFAELGRAVGAAQYIRTAVWMQAFTRRMAAWWAGGFDLLLTPTIGEPPPKIGEIVPPRDNPLAGLTRTLSVIPFTPQFNITGQAAISLPLHWNAAGLPVGVQLVAAYGAEDLLIRAASQVERARPWIQERPPVYAG